MAVSSGSVEVAQDVVSEAFARALERWDRVGRMESPTGWVRQVAVNLLRRRFRRAALEQQLLRRHPPRDEVAPSPDVDPALWAAVLALPPRQRAVLGLRVVLDLSQDDTARLLGIRPATVSATLGHARKHLEQAVADTTPEVDHA
jgi:RNA polymerase sigma-70 factor (ECF subfamily)